MTTKTYCPQFMHRHCAVWVRCFVGAALFACGGSARRLFSLFRFANICHSTFPQPLQIGGLEPQAPILPSFHYNTSSGEFDKLCTVRMNR